MKKRLLLILIIIGQAFLFAQENAFIGNATRGSDDSFSGSPDQDGLYGISLIVPAGKSVRVTNLKNNLTEEILIVEGKAKPGIQLLLNSSASDALKIFPGEVIQVSSVELSGGTNPFLSYAEDPERFKKDMDEEFLEKEKKDPDYGSAVDVEEEMEKLGYETAEEEETAPAEGDGDDIPEPGEGDIKSAELEIAEKAVDDSFTEPEETVDAVENKKTLPIAPESNESDWDDIVIAHPEEDLDDVLDIDDIETDQEREALEAEPTVVDEPEAEAAPENESEPEIVDAEPFATDMVALDEETSSGEDSPEESVRPDRVIYFLTPAELRPPDVTEENEEILPPWDDDDEESLVIEGEAEEDEPTEKALDSIPSMTLYVPQYVEADELDSYMEETVRNGSRYIQVISLDEKKKDDLYKNMTEIQDNFPYIPLLVLPSNKDGFLRLVAGPVSRDEVGILLYAIRAHGFDDALLVKE